MSAPNFKFYELSEDASEQLQLAPLPFPVRSRRAKSVFEKAPLKLDKILEELEVYLKANPEHTDAYAENTVRLAMICATNHMHAEDTKAALVSLGIGLRADPGNNTLKLHQALALQTLGYHELAAYEYDQLLQIAPIAYDPVVRSLASKAFSAAGHKDKALSVLEALPEVAFNDEGLSSLREFLSDQGEADIEARTGKAKRKKDGKKKPAKRTKPAQKTKGAPPNKDAGPKFCTSCGKARSGDVKFCTSCGAKAA